MALPVLRRGSKGDAVSVWQNFLIGKGLLDQADGIFGQDTEDAKWNPLGHTPALRGKEGSVRLLVPIR